MYAELRHGDRLAVPVWRSSWYADCLSDTAFRPASNLELMSGGAVP